MSISSSAIASLVIAATAVGSSTFAVMANTSSSEMSPSNITQVVDPGLAPKIPSETPAPLVDGTIPASPSEEIVSQTPFVVVTPAPTSTPTSTPTPTPTSTPKPIVPVVPPLNFGGGDDDEDEEYEDEDSDDDSFGDEHHGDHDEDDEDDD